MSELGGGNDFPAGKDAPLKGKETGKKVQFNDVDWSKGGKGGKGAGGKNSVSKEPPKYELNVEQELPRKAECLMDCEAKDILQGVNEQMIILSRDPTIKLPPSFQLGLQYAESTAQYTDAKAVREVFQNLKIQGVPDGEICIIANMCPESLQEVFALLPTLKAKRSKVSDALTDALGKLEELKRPE